MIENKRMFYTGVGLLAALILIRIPFPHNVPYGETIAAAFISPIEKGLDYVGIISFGLLLASLTFLVYSTNKYTGRIVILAIVVQAIAPVQVVNLYQNTIATGVYALSYDSALGDCHFDMIDDSILQGECFFPFKNHSDKDVQFTIEFYDKHYIAHDVQLGSLMNHNAPYNVTLEGKERRMVTIETYIDVSKMEQPIRNGSFSRINIIIKSGEKIRRL